jgi:YbgC/YbaW family acyl-CoA thioester hydrolase
MSHAFSVIHRVQFSETDMAGIVHFSNYLRMMEEVEHAYFRSIGLSVSMQHDDIHVGWPRVAAACEYFEPVKFEDEIEMRLRVTRVGGKSFSYEVDFMVRGTRAALGKITSVCCAIEAGELRAISIPPAIREKLTKDLSDSGTKAEHE